MENFILNILLPGGIILAIVGFLFFLLSMVYGILQNLKGSTKLLIALGVVVIIFGISYTLASDSNPSSIDVSPGTIKFVTAGIITTGFMTIGAFVVWIGTGIYDLIK